MREQIDEQRPRLISSTNRHERINVPEVAYEKGALRGAETIIIRIAHDPALRQSSRSIAFQVLMNRGSVAANSPAPPAALSWDRVHRSSSIALVLSANRPALYSGASDCPKAGNPSKQTPGLILGLFLPMQSGGWSASLLPRTTDWTSDYNAALAKRATQHDLERG